MADLLLTIGETAAALRVSVRQVRALARHGLPVVRLSRKTLLVRRTDLDTFIAARVDTTVSNMLSGGHDRSGGATGPGAAPPHAGAARRQARRPRDDGEPVGTGNGAGPRAGRPLDSVRRRVRVQTMKEDPQ